MLPSTTTSLAIRRWAQNVSCQWGLHTRHLNTQGAYMPHSNPPYVRPKVTFESIGIRAPIASALRSAFPNVKNPTTAQLEFIPAILSGRDVILKDETGSGKSFGILLALLNKARRSVKLSGDIAITSRPFITSLVVVPHRDLAFQFHHWIERLVQSSAPSGQELPSLQSIARVCVRGAESSIPEQREALLAEPPHILIGTPQALLELFNESFSSSQMRSISSVYVDEVDYLVDAIPQHDSIRDKEKIRRKILKHPGPTTELLDRLFAVRKKWREHAASGISTTMEGPQLIFSSATLRRDLRSRLCSNEGWLYKHSVVKVMGNGEAVSGPEPNGGVLHSVLIVSKDGHIRNIEGAVEAPAGTNTTIESRAFSADEVFGSSEVTEIPVAANAGALSNKKLTIDLNALETVATAFAMDVPSVALLSLPASAPVQRIVQELRDLGVNAQSLDLTAVDKGRTHLLRGATEASEENPILLVSTLATTRGLDLPELTHVFVIGLPEDARADSYMHNAGRVGRFGRSGKVITVLTEPEPEPLREGEATARRAKDTPKQMLNILKIFGIVPTQLEHFD